MDSDTPESASTQRHTYVIDHDYRVVYMDSAARRMFPAGQVGALCYESFRGASEPCSDCPWRRDRQDGTTQTVIFSAKRDAWFEITCLEVDWFDCGPCVLFSGRPVDDDSRSLFSTLSQPSSYDELFELNLTDDAYKVLYTEPDKYVMPALEGQLSVMFVDVLEHMIHPEDRTRFQEFWNFDTLLTRIEQAGGTLRGEFRKRLMAGGWGWAAQTVVPVKRGGNGETVVMCFIADIDAEVKARKGEFENTQLLQLKEHDQLTGLYNAVTFYERAEALVKEHPEDRFEVAYLDIEHFKLYNEWHGREAGDIMLRSIAERFTFAAEHFGGVAGYLGGDDFAVVLPAGTVTEAAVEHDSRRPPFDSEDTIGFQPAVGVCTIEPGEAVGTACDHAMIAMASVKGAYGKRIAWYENSMTEELESETKTLLEVQRALANHEFVLYWQPQCSTRTGRIVGLEALVRWQHPRRGLIMPGDFVPVLERNGFIASLDLYVWEEACRQLRGWIDRGEQPIPVSVNISRADLYAIDVVTTFEELLQRYRLNHRLLELEITESAYAEDERMTTTVERLKERGFTILMDDFGSGYSSLNMLKDVNVDIIKIDMGFLNRANESKRSESILEAVVSMARLMDLRIIAEGTETKEQVDFLQSIGCDYAQGYYFYRPMSTDTLEALLSQEGIVDLRGMLSPTMELIDMKTLLRDDATSNAIIDSLVGGVAVYAVYPDRFELLQVNNAYYRVTGCNAVDLCERQKLISRQVHPDDLPIVMSMFAQAEHHPVTGAEGTFRRYRLNGELMWMHMKAFFLRHEQDRSIFFCSLSDVTEERQEEKDADDTGREQQDTPVQRTACGNRLLDILKGQAEDHWYVNLTTKSFLNAADRQAWHQAAGLVLDDWTATTPAERIGATVRPGKDAAAVAAFLNFNTLLANFEQGKCYGTLEYRQEDERGERWMELSYRLIRLTEQGSVYAYLSVTDIDERKRRELKLEELAAHDALTGLLNRQAAATLLPGALAETEHRGVPGALVIVDLDNFKLINDQFGHLAGDTVLSGVGRHLKRAFRKDDLVCRWGGDEFIVYCHDISQESLVERVKGLCNNPWMTRVGRSETVELSASAGVALVPDHGTAFAEVYHHADIALYRAKSEGKARFRVFEA